MKTTRKEFYLKVQNHIADCLSDDNGETLAEQLQAVADEFAQYWNGYEKRRSPNKQAAFIDWLHGLPSCLSIDFYYYDQRQRLQEWHDQPEAEAAIYSDAEVDANYCYLIFREFCKMCKAAGVNF